MPETEYEEIESWSEESIQQATSLDPTLFGIWDNGRWVTLGTEEGWGKRLSPHVFFTEADAEDFIKWNWFDRATAIVLPLNGDLPRLLDAAPESGNLF